MLSFKQFISESLLLEKHPFLFHGTSSHFLPGIKKTGLTNSYVTTHPHIASDEAYGTTEGEPSSFSTAKKAKGGVPHIVVINRNHPSAKGFKADQEYKSPKRRGKFAKDDVAFKHNGHIHPDAVVDHFPANDINKLNYYAKKQGIHISESYEPTEWSHQVDRTGRESDHPEYGYSLGTTEADHKHAKNQGEISICPHCEDWFAGKHGQEKCYKCLGHKLQK